MTVRLVDDLWPRIALALAAAALLANYFAPTPLEISTLASATSSEDVLAGLELSAVMELGPGTLGLVVDDRGAADPTTIAPLVVTELAHLFASDAAAVDLFGSSVAVSGDTAVVGALGDDTNTGINAGSAYVFVRDGTTWTEQAHLVASDGLDADQFGNAVALDGDIAVIGAYADDTPAGVDAGSAYVFVRDGTTWTEQAHLVASDGAAGNSFGRAVAIAGETVLVGASPLDASVAGTAGSAYVFVRNGTTWSEQARLVASDGLVGDQFGQAVALAGDTAVIGAEADDTPAGVDAGSVYIFTRNRATWTQRAHLVASDGAAGDSFGSAVSVAGDTSLIGALGDSTTPGSGGSVYVFVRSGTSWTEQGHLVPPEDVGSFGASVALVGDTALIGAPGTDTAVGPNVGSAFVFVRVGTNWTSEAQIFGSGGDRNDSFGGSVALSGDTAVIGARFDDTDAGPDAGSAYVFKIPPAFSCTITGTEGDDVLIGTDGDDVICGLGGNDVLIGLGGNDILLGGAGNDVLDGGPGVNILDGGEGIDTATYARARQGVTANLELGTASGPSTDTLLNIENLVGSRFNDRLTGDAGDNFLDGRQGRDLLDGGPGTDTCRNGERLISCELS